ncbi:hypothetical protein ACQP1W_41580 [Spirillospora sp. CA-255316]
MKGRAGERREGGIDEMRRVFREAGLGTPPVPEEMGSLVEKRERWAFATRDIDPMGMYMFLDHILEVLSGPVEDYMAVSHAGHGVNSYAVNYHLVMGPVAVFAQTGWGGVYMDAKKSAADVRTMLSRCGELLDALQELNEAQPRRRYDGRLLVAQSTFRGTSLCQWITPPLPGGRAGEFLNDPGQHEPTPEDRYPALTEAIRLIRTDSLPPP